MPSFKQAVQDVIDNQGQTAPGDLTSSGPASQSGTPTSSTTTDSTGTKTTTTTPTYTYHYDGDTITYDTSSTVQTCVGSNSCSTTTTTTPASPVDAQDPTDPCTKNPNRVGCMSLGDPPNDQVPKAQRTLSYSQESIGLPVGCPADVTVQTSRGPQVFSYAKTCDVAATSKPWVLAAAAFTALLIVLAALREL